MSVVEPVIHGYPSKETFVEGAARFIAERVMLHIENRGECRLAIAGGNTPRPVYERLAQDDLAQTVKWSNVHVFWGDERCVSPDDDGSNYRMACSALLSHVPVIPSNVHRIEGERGSIRAAQRYAETLGNEPLDIVLLGMGGDGHTASLFPDARNLATDERVVSAISPVAPAERVSISLQEINDAGEAHLLVAGTEKKERLIEVLQQIESGRPVLPAARVQPRSGLLFWLTDTAIVRHVMERPNTESGMRIR